MDYQEGIEPPVAGELARAAGKVFPLQVCKSRAGFFHGLSLLKSSLCP